MHDKFPAHAVAIIGLAGRFPGARSLEEFWRNIRDGVESLQTFSDADLDAAGVPAALRANPQYVRRGTVLEDVDQFDAAYFGMSPREAQVLDPQHRIFLECAVEALDHAGYGGPATELSVGVYAGASMNTYLLAHILRNAAFAEAVGGYQIMLGNDKDFLCTRASYKLDLHGPSMTVQTACSTSLVAVQVACRALQRGECDMALAGGVSVTFPLRAGYLFQEGMILSPDGHCRPFDVQAHGTRAGAGAGIVVLKRLSDALKDGDTIHAVIRGAAINNDGAGKAGYTAPSIDGQIEVIALAQSLAGVEPRSISYVEAHGTGTPLGDPIEIAALTQVFRAASEEVGFCRLGSLKANLGHLDAAAGVAGLIKTVLALEHQHIPPLVNFRQANPQLELETSPFSAIAQGSPWVGTDTPRRAGVSSFGIGGTNAHVVLEEAPAAVAGVAARSAHLLVLSAKTPTALDQATANLAAHLASHPEQAMADVEWTLQAGRMPFAHRRAVVANDAAHALSLLQHPERAPVVSGVHDSGVRPVAFLFSGQGSQHVGMGAGLYRSEAVYRQAVDTCAGLLEPELGLDIRTIIFGDPGDAAIHETRLTQPALFVTEFALATLWMHWGVTPSAMLGHSIGEYVAAHLAGVMSLSDALRLVTARGRLMQALPAGSMAAVHLSAAELGPWIGSGIEIAALNAAKLCTLSGPTEAMTKLLQRMQAAGIDSRALHTSHAFHSAMMEPALVPFRAVFQTITLAPPSIPYLSNLTGTWITAEQATSPDYYTQHLRQAVQFEAGLRTVAADPTVYLLEVGPGNALASLARMSLGTDGARRALSSLPHPRDKRADVESLLDACGRLWIAGAPVDWKQLQTGATLRRVPLPTYPFERKRFWVESLGAAPAAARSDEAGGEPRYANPDDWFYSSTWSRDDSLAALLPALSGTWFVLGDHGSLTAAVVAQVAAAGGNPVLVLRGDSIEHRIDPSNGVAGVINLWCRAVRSAAHAQAAYAELVTLSAALAPMAAKASIRLLIATTAAQRVLDESERNVPAALLLGPALVLPIEVPGLLIRCVDLESSGNEAMDAEQASVLVGEARCADAEALAAHRLGHRWLRRFERLDLPAAAPQDLPLKTRGAYLITGGLGGIGLALARWLAKDFSARLLLTARTALPPRTQWDEWLRTHTDTEHQSLAIQAIREIESSGAEVMLAVADVSDESAMGRAVAAAVQRWGALDGLIHAAGVSGSGSLAVREAPAAAAAVFAPKVQGLSVLIRVLGKHSLDFVALMSSVNTFIGTAGSCDYTAANAVLDAYADSRERPVGWRQLCVFNWGPWSDVGMAKNLVVPDSRRLQWQAHLEAGIPARIGVQAFARGLASGRPHIIVYPYDMTRTTARVREYLRGQARAAEIPAGESAAVVASASRPELASGYEAPTTATESQLTAIWIELLGVEGIGVNDDFFELGGHSLLATRVLARIDESFAVRLALRDIFDAPTVRLLAARITAPGSGTLGDDREELEF